MLSEQARQYLQNLPPKEKTRLGIIDGKERELFETKYLQMKQDQLPEQAPYVLVATRDPGSGAALLPVLKELQDKVHLTMVTDGRAEESIEKQFQTHDVMANEQFVFANEAHIKKPDIILLDKSSNMGIELHLIATYEDVPFVVVEDTYTNSLPLLRILKERGLRDPDHICVMDAYAKQIITKEFPHLASCIEITGQPSFDRFATEPTENIAKEVRQKLDISEQQRLVSYMSTIDEPEKITLLAQTLATMENKESLVIAFRRHPRDNTPYQTFHDIFQQAGIQAIDTTKYTTDQISAASDIVLTTWSTEAIHAMYRGKPTIHIFDDRFRKTPSGSAQEWPPVAMGASLGIDQVEDIANILPTLMNPNNPTYKQIIQGASAVYKPDGKNAARVADVVINTINKKHE